MDLQCKTQSKSKWNKFKVFQMAFVESQIKGSCSFFVVSL